MRKSPGHVPGLILRQVPSGRLLGPVVMTAERREIALTGKAALVVGDRVIEVADVGRSPAARERAAALPNPDQMGQGSRGSVAVLRPEVLALCCLQVGQLARKPLRPLPGARAGRRTMARRSAGVRDSLPGRSGQSQARPR